MSLLGSLLSPTSLDSNDKGYFATESALTTAYPTGENGWLAIVGSTDTVWVWDSGTSSWVNTGNSGTGSVTEVSVATANGFDATVTNPTTTPEITLKTTITGIIKGNGTALQEAEAGVDYIAPSNLQREEVSGIKNSSNTVFTISHTPIANSLNLYLNGQLLREGLSDDYTISGSTITLAAAPSSGESVFATYLS